MAQQTAVEWLVSELNQKIDFIPIDKWDMIRDIVQQAKQMEKEQIIKSYKKGFSEGTVFGTVTIYKFQTSEEYYIETYAK
jgi:hypothetical protein